MPKLAAMVEEDAERFAANNPADILPASQTLSRETILSRQNTQRRRQYDSTNVLKRRVSITDPAGDERETRSSSRSNQPKTKYDVGWRRVVRNFSPSWFSVTMGTGIVALLLITIPWKARWLYWLSIVFFILNTFLFFTALAISILRYSLYPEIWTVMINSTNALFLGTIPMGFATLVEMWIFVCIPAWGPWATTFAWVCWMIDSVVAALVTLSLSILLISQTNQQSLDRITAAQLLPIAATIVAAGAGAEIAGVLPNPEHALGTLITSYVMWGMSVPLAMAVLVMYYQRLALHKLPPREVIVSCFLPLGPLGMGGYTIMYLGKISRVTFTQTKFFHDLPVAGDVVYIMGIFIALIMWGFGLVWLVFALSTIYQCRPFPFNMGWWGFTFPLGVFSVSTITFGLEMPSLFFRVLGTILSVAVVILWIVVAAGTAKGAFSGELFYAPCLADLKEKEKVPEVQQVENGIEMADEGKLKG